MSNQQKKAPVQFANGVLEVSDDQLAGVTGGAEVLAPAPLPDAKQNPPPQLEGRVYGGLRIRSVGSAAYDIWTHKS